MKEESGIQAKEWFRDLQARHKEGWEACQEILRHADAEISRALMSPVYTGEIGISYQTWYDFHHPRSVERHYRQPRDDDEAAVEWILENFHRHDMWVGGMSLASGYHAKRGQKWFTGYESWPKGFLDDLERISPDTIEQMEEEILLMWDAISMEHEKFRRIEAAYYATGKYPYPDDYPEWR
ncbi:hypothetical protein FACS1894164_12100 [Spirochaetia bacterium]|nr:hypothetical protein FACS1894164_12100 [Spirochaetia bacterium]